MKPISLRMLFGCLVAVSVFPGACKKSSSPGSSTSLNGTWQTTVWGGSGDTARVLINTGAGLGIMSYLSAGAMSATNFTVNDTIFSSIISTGNNTYSTIGTYRYNGSGANNSTEGHTSGTITLQGSGTILVQYAEDQSTGIQPPNYSWTRQ